MLLETSLDGVRLLLLGADDSSRSARRFRAAGAQVRAVEVPDGADALPAATAPGARGPQDDDGAAPGVVVVVGDREPWEPVLQRLREAHGPLPVSAVPAPGEGVSLVGGGPGEPGLMTVRGLEAVADADVVLVDRLAPQGVVEAQAPHAEIVRVGKWPGHHPVPQEQIQQQLLSAAAGGRRVVRLKGGDPYVFGRGGEEAADCESWGVPVETVPGITSAVAVPGAAGIPLTFREVSRAFTVASGHVPFDDDELGGFAALLGTGATLVVLMGVSTLPQLAAGLIRAGASAELPIALIEKGFSPDQRVLTGRLGTAVTDLAAAQSPAVTVIGPVAALAAEDRERVLGELTPHRAVAPGNGGDGAGATGMTDRSAPTDRTAGSPVAHDRPADIEQTEQTEHGPRPEASGTEAEALSRDRGQGQAGPLAGRRIAVTAHRRADDQMGALRRRGAEVLAAPSLKLVPVEEDAEVVADTRRLLAARPGLFVITTGYGFKRWWEVVEAAGLADEALEVLSRADLWVRGPKGRAAVRNLGLRDVGISPDETLPPLVELILDAYDHDLSGAVVAWQENGFADRDQRERLVAAGAEAVTVTPHRWADADETGAVPELIRSVCRRDLDAVTFTSAAGAQALVSTAAAMGLGDEFAAAFQPGPGAGDGEADAAPVLAATVGPVTAQPLEEAGIPALVPERFRMGAMIQQLVDALGPRG
ncbi:uroporphyrinogen-III C-methyltransferase [Kocuria palustris]|uniref:uroporphyrinogen-III C-methyltransferase n=1 Tax=Kocuria palustris TaxID=71999 RepID=UPI0011A15810|nr:uroporphyrinogen-III C-methyltransferase [Kocuria palustris]